MKTLKVFDEIDRGNKNILDFVIEHNLEDDWVKFMKDRI